MNVKLRLSRKNFHVKVIFFENFVIFAKNVKNGSKICENMIKILVDNSVILVLKFSRESKTKNTLLNEIWR